MLLGFVYKSVNLKLDLIVESIFFKMFVIFLLK